MFIDPAVQRVFAPAVRKDGRVPIAVTLLSAGAPPVVKLEIYKHWAPPEPGHDWSRTNQPVGNPVGHDVRGGGLHPEEVAFKNPIRLRSSFAGSQCTV